MLTRYEPYVPRLLDEPWSGSRIAPGAFVFCELNGLIGNGHATGQVATLAGKLFAAAEPHGGDVLSFGGSTMSLLFTGDGRQGRAINAVHAMHEVVGDNGVSMAAGIASGMVHLVTLGEGPRHLMSIGPTVTRAIELAGLAGPGETRSERIDSSGMSTQGKPVGWPPEDFVAPAVLSIIEGDNGALADGNGVVAFGMFSGVDHALGRNPGRATGLIATVIERVQRAAAAFDVTVVGNAVAPGGGALLLATGLERGADDAEERMLLAAKAALHSAPPLALRFGVATGPLMAGSIGGRTRRTYAVVGETVDLAARLAATAGPGEVLTTHRTVDRTSTRYAISEWEPITFKSLGGSVVPVTVGRELSETARGGGFVGRSSEQALLTRAVEALREGSGGVIEIVGGAGIGKSRLVEEALGETGLKTVRLRCDEYRRHSPYSLASKLLRGIMGIDPEADTKRVGMELRAQVRDLTPYLERWLPLLAEVTGGRVKQTSAVRRVPTECRRLRTSAATAQFIGWLVQEPTVITIEDVQWMDASSARLLSFVFGSDLPCLVVATRRPSADGWLPGELERARSIELEPLAPGPRRALFTELLRENPPGDEAMTALIERSGGNPMFIELLAGHEWVGGSLPPDVPAAVGELVTAIDEPSRAALGGASVLGTVFAPDDAGDLLRGVDWSALAEYVEPIPGGRLRFRHGAVREAIVAGVDEGTLAGFHGELAARTRDAGESVLHLHRAGAHAETWLRGVAAAEDAAQRGAHDEAASLLGLAVEAGRRAGTTKKELAAAYQLLGDAAVRAGRFEEADDAFASALELVRAGRDRARLTARRAEVREREGRYPAALRLLTAASKALPKSASAVDQAVLDYQYARVRLRQGRVDDAIERAQRAISGAERASDDQLLGRAALLAGRAMQQRDPGSGVERIERSTAVFARLGDRRRLADALDDLAHAAHRDGRHGDALGYLDRAVAARDAAGDVVGAAFASYRLAEVNIELGRLDDASVALERVRSAARATMARLLAARASMRSAEIDARRGNTALALGMLEQAEARFEDLGADEDAATTRLIRAEAHLLAGAVEEALAASEKSLESAPEGRARIGLGRVRGTALVWMGRSREGHLQLMEALDAAQTMGAPVEEAMISDALATLYGDDDAADRRDEIMARLGIVRLPPFLTID